MSLSLAYFHFFPSDMLKYLHIFQAVFEPTQSQQRLNSSFCVCVHIDIAIQVSVRSQSVAKNGLQGEAVTYI